MLIGLSWAVGSCQSSWEQMLSELGYPGAPRRVSTKPASGVRVRMGQAQLQRLTEVHLTGTTPAFNSPEDYG